MNEQSIGLIEMPEFSAPDSYNERHAHLEVGLPRREGVIYMDMKVGNREPFRCHIALTLGPSGPMSSTNAIWAQCTNVDADWGSEQTDPKEIRILHGVGTIEQRGPSYATSFHLWFKA